MSFADGEAYSFFSTISKQMHKYLWPILLCLCACGQAQVQTAGESNTEARILDAGFLMDDGFFLPAKTYLPEARLQGLVIALHGFNDYSKAFTDLCQFMQDRQYACFAFDQRSFGGTDGRGIWAGKGRMQEDLKLVVSLLAAKYPDLPLFVLGESMGGAVALTSAVRFDSVWKARVSGSILLAPAVWARSSQPWYQRTLLWLAVHTVPGWSPTGEGLGVQASDNIEALRDLGRDPMVIKATRIDAIYGLNNLMDEALESASSFRDQVLFLYGMNDEVIPKAPSCEALNRLSLSGSRLSAFIYPDGYHMLSRDLQRVRVFEDIYQWMMHHPNPAEHTETWQDYCSG